MKRALITFASSLLLAASVTAQPSGMGMGMGMMGSASGRGMGPDMMWGGYEGDAFSGLDLSTDQRKQVTKIQDEVRKSHWQLMSSMHQQGYHMYSGFGPGALDEADAMHATEKAMFELSLGARKRIDAVLTTAQREQLHREWTPR
jgi:Spy/CpxP family protein refolding chaperone